MVQRPMMTSQRKERCHKFIVDGTGTASITEGGQNATLTDNNTGDYTLTLTNPSTRAIHAQITPVSASGTALLPSIISATATAVQWEIIDEAETQTDAVCHVTLTAWDVADET